MREQIRKYRCASLLFPLWDSGRSYHQYKARLIYTELSVCETLAGAGTTCLKAYLNIH